MADSGLKDAAKISNGLSESLEECTICPHTSKISAFTFHAFMFIFMISYNQVLTVFSSQPFYCYPYYLVRALRDGQAFRF